MQKSIYFLLCKYNVLYKELFNILLLSAQFLSFFLLGVGNKNIYQSIHSFYSLLLLFFPLFSHGYIHTAGQRFGTEGQAGLSRLQSHPWEESAKPEKLCLNLPKYLHRLTDKRV